MVSSTAADPEAFLAEIEDDARRALVSKLRDVVNANLPDGYLEGMGYGMIGWTVPMAVSGPTYNGQPLAIVSLANQKNAVSIYLMGIYSFPDAAEAFKAEWKASGRKLDMGKSCVRVKKWDDVAEQALANAIAAVSVTDFLGAVDAAHG